MELYYKNETLFVDIVHDITWDTIELLKRRVFRILDDYGIDKVIIHIDGSYDKHLINAFKKEYYQKYKGYMIIQ